MKKLLVALITMAMLSLASTVLACPPEGCNPGVTGLPETWSVTWNPTPDVYMKAGYSSANYQFTFDLTTVGFVAGVDEIKAFEFALSFKDDHDTASEWVSILVSETTPDIYSWQYNINDYTSGIINGTARAALEADGKLVVYLTANNGDFYFEQGTLTAGGCDVTQTPEPASMMLFGLGLIGLAGLRRKFKK